ncbi:unnamed protein product [Amoebophrya sp. A120]|nr:unnamed protein product [Amoebophrya sp. A120]|eukprot:GSA120T00021276001.1
MVKAGKRHENAKGPHAPAASTASGRAKCQRSEQNNGNCSNIRGHYVDSGVDEYYANTDNYRNPHEERVREVLRQVLDDFARRSGHVESSRQADGANAFFRVLDLCAGSGEVTAVLLDYESEKLVETVTAEATSKARAMNEARHTFDKAEESTTHRSFLRPFYIQACDPYTHHLYERRIFGSCGMEKLRKQGQASRVQRCLPLSFQDILQGKLALVTSSFGSGAESSVDNSRAAADLNNNFDLIVCSYALHLCPQDQLPMVALLLSDVAKFLLIVTPHKRPVLKPEWGWVRVTKHGDQKEARDAQASADEIIGNEQQKEDSDRVAAEAFSPAFSLPADNVGGAGGSRKSRRAGAAPPYVDDPCEGSQFERARADDSLRAQPESGDEEEVADEEEPGQNELVYYCSGRRTRGILYRSTAFCDGAEGW